ncbi:MAG: gp58-like family protein [Peptostreptococcaceae bacterium]
MSVSKFIEYAQNFENNIKHKYSIKIDGIETNYFIYNREDFTISDSLKSGSEDKFSPNTISLSFTFRDDMLEKKTFELSKSTFFNAYIRDLVFIDDRIKNWLFNQQKIVDGLKVKDVFKLRSEVKVTGMIDEYTYDIFTGVVSEVEFVKKNTYFEVNMLVKSNMIKAYTKKFPKDEVLVDYFISNSTNKEKSLLHRWAKMMDYSDVEIVDFKYKDNTYIQIPYVQETKDESIIAEFSELVRSVNGVMRVEDDLMIVRSYTGVQFPINDVANENNIQEPFTTKEIDPEYKQIKVTFDQYSRMAETYVWGLKGENGTSSSANVLVPKNTPLDKQELRWIIDWQPSGLCAEWRILSEDIRAYKVTGEQPPNAKKEYIKLEYALIDVGNGGGYVKFYNTLDVDIVIEKFKITGIPIIKNSGNEFNFTKAEQGHITDNQILEKSNRYVQTLKHVQHYAQLCYNTECEKYTEVSFRYNHCLAYMKAGANIFVRHPLAPELEIVVDSLSHTGNLAEIKGTTYEPFKFIDATSDVILNQGASENDLKTDDIINEDIFNSDKPSPPIEFKVLEAFGSCIVKATASMFETNVKGFNIYYRPDYQQSWIKYYTGSPTTVIYDLSPSIVYEFKATCVTYKGSESESTQSLFAQPKQIDSGLIEYPIGQSPEELKDAKDKLEQIVEEAIIENDRKYEQLEQEFITTGGKFNSIIEQKIADFDKNVVQRSISEIKQTSDEIELKVQKTEGEISNLSQPTNLISLINIAPEGVTIKGSVIKLNDGFRVNADGSVDIRNLQADWIVTGTLDADKINVRNLKVSQISGLQDDLNNALSGGQITITSNTKVKGTLEAFGGNGIISYNGYTEATSTKRIIVKGGEILFQEKVN